MRDSDTIEGVAFPRSASDMNDTDRPDCMATSLSVRRSFLRRFRSSSPNDIIGSLVGAGALAFTMVFRLSTCSCFTPNPLRTS